MIAATVATVSVIGAAAIGLAQGGPHSSPPASLNAAAFDWLQPRAIPAGWSMWRLPRSPARLPAPLGWRREDGDPGTRTVVLKGPRGRIAGYLNATPRQGDETTGNWSEFRIAHNEEEGDRDVRLLAAATNVSFRGAIGSCVLDSYRTSSGNRYREVACIASGRSATNVIVAAAPPARWPAEAPTLERSITTFTT
jgi:hypothetical protein